MRMLSRASAWCDVFSWERPAGLALLASLVTFPLACAGGQVVAQGAQSAENPSSPAAAPSTSPPQTADAPTTTTETLDAAGDPHGTKLVEKSGDPSPADAPSAPKQPHSHDPGRGLDDIRAIVIAHRGEAQACYDRALADHPGIEGDLVLTWTIDPKGNVTQIDSDVSRSQITEPQVLACVSDVIRKIQFAVSPGGFETRASYPFRFRPRRGKPAP